MMQDLRNCPRCGKFFNYTGLQNVCGQCVREEEKIYQKVSQFLRRRENRSAEIDRIVEVTGVERDLLYKWVRTGRLQPSLFPNLGYPCEKCGELTTKGKLCESCIDELQSELDQFEAAQNFREAIQEDRRGTYHSDRKRN